MEVLMRNPDYQSNLSTILTLIVLAALAIGLMFGASEEAAIRENQADAKVKAQIAELMEAL